MQLAKKYPEDFLSKVKAVYLADSAHFENYVGKSAHNYFPSGKPLGTVLGYERGVMCVSAGTVKHEWVPSSAIQHIHWLGK